MSEHDDAKAAEASRRKAVEKLSGDGLGDGSEAVQEAVQALHEGAGKTWTPEQEAQIRAMVEQSRKLRSLNRPGGGRWRRRREQRARGRLVDMMMDGSPELVNEVQLRNWRSLAVTELLLAFAGSAMKQEDTEATLAQVEAVYAVTYEEYQRAKKALAEEKAAAG
ncbi:hypothetical protein [Streptomyces nojiriensis]|uniref:hypothetical protein n=1 Tax=Streptomyces nojiriensis TaxID=66374 RepID=UPI0035DEE35E